MKSQLLFILSSARLFTQFTSFFQREDPLIHLLYDEVKRLIITVAGRICKQQAVKSFKTDVNQDPFDSKNLISPKDIIFDEELRKELLLLSEKDRGYFLTDVQHHYVASGRYLLNKGILQNKNLKHLSCLNPEFRYTPKSLKHIAKLGEKLPIDIKIDVLLDEWRSFKLNQGELGMNRIDSFWSNCIQAKQANGELQYPNLSKFLKSSLSLYHGSADIERGFSISNQILSEERTSMRERMLNARLNILDVLKHHYSNQAALVPINSSMIRKANVAYQNYQSYLENENREKEKRKKEVELQKAEEGEESRKKETEKIKNEINDLEKKLKDLNKDVGEQVAVTDRLITKAIKGNKRLKSALEKGNLTEAKIAQSMITAGVTANEELKVKKSETHSLCTVINKRKNNLITNFMSKKPKKG